MLDLDLDGAGRLVGAQPRPPPRQNRDRGRRWHDSRTLLRISRRSHHRATVAGNLRAAGEADFIVKQVQKYSPAAQAIFGAAVGRRAADIEGTLADATLSFELSA